MTIAHYTQDWAMLIMTSYVSYDIYDPPDPWESCWTWHENECDVSAELWPREQQAPRPGGAKARFTIRGGCDEEWKWGEFLEINFKLGNRRICGRRWKSERKDVSEFFATQT
jgi:hypothetical protein